MILTYPLPDPLNGGNLATEIELAASLAAGSVRVTAFVDHMEVHVPDGTPPALVDAAVANHTGLPTPEQELEAKIRSTGLPFTADRYNAVRAQMQTLRALRQMGRGPFMDLTAVERDRVLYDAFSAVTQVLLAILRDEDPRSLPDAARSTDRRSA